MNSPFRSEDDPVAQDLAPVPGLRMPRIYFRQIALILPFCIFVFCSNAWMVVSYHLTTREMLTHPYFQLTVGFAFIGAVWAARTGRVKLEGALKRYEQVHGRPYVAWWSRSR